MTCEPERKKAKTDHKDSSSTTVKDRLKELQDKILALKEDYPELACIDQSRLHSCLDEAFVKYTSEQGRLENEQHCQLYKLPNEILQKCFEYVGDKSYLFTATVSKKFHDAYMSKYTSQRNNGKFTSYRYGACSTSLAKYCVETLCKTQGEKDQIFIAGAVNGNIEILEYALEEGNDLLPIINCSGFEDVLFHELLPERDVRLIHLDCAIGDPDEGSTSGSSGIARIAREGHLHVLKYLYEKVNFRMGMQLASYEAINCGHLDIVEWLNSIDYLEELRTTSDGFDRVRYFCDEYRCPAKVLQWLMERGYYDVQFNHPEFSPFYEHVLELADKDLLDYCLSKGFEFQEEAINSLAYYGNIEFAEYCEEKGLKMTSDAYLHAGETGNLEMVKFLHRGGIQWHGDFTTSIRNLEILKFANERGYPWDADNSDDVNYGDLELLQCLHTYGYPWNSNDFQHFLLLGEKASIEVFQFLHEKGCPWDKRFSKEIIVMKDISFLKYLHESGLPYENDLLEVALRQQWFDGVKYIIESEMKCERPKAFSKKIVEMKDISFLKYLHESGLPYENDLLEVALRLEWFDGVKYIIESEMKCKRPTDLGSVVCSESGVCSDYYKCHDFEILKYLKSTGMEWGTKGLVFDYIVSSDSKFKDRLEVFQWAIESGCPLGDAPKYTFYWAFHSWLEDPSNQQKRDILSYLQKRDVPQGNIFHDYHY